MNRIELSERLRSTYPINNRAMAFRKKLHGIGANDADYLTKPRVDGKQVTCPAYEAWSHVISRAYSKKFHAKCPTYIGVTVCTAWSSFMEFRGWWIKNHVDGWQLDKDLLGDSKIYSPESCIYIPSWLNSFNTDRKALRGKWPIGVRLHKKLNKFESRCRNPMTRNSIYLGLFDSPADAHQAWIECKTNLAVELKPQMDRIHLGLFHGVIRAIKGDA
ncbi:AP2/ERF family transcription factor [Aeromonas sobria]|uniref:hypothetical protein n=1 Tax=Aeromonas sobria TaxID=646 RepID=UPI001CA31F88|nr:hypothetical protein [Aeromonas sobria]